MASGIDEVVEQPGDEGAQGLLLRLEEVRLGPAHSPALRRVAVVGVVGDGDVFPRLVEFIGQRRRIELSMLVVNEVLQVVGVAALLGEAEQDHRLRNEDAPLGRLRRDVAVDLGVAVVQRLDLRGEDAPAVLGAHGEQPPPDILAVAARPEFECPVAGQFRVAAPDRLLHRARHRWERVAALGWNSLDHDPSLSCVEHVTGSGLERHFLLELHRLAAGRVHRDTVLTLVGFIAGGNPAGAAGRFRFRIQKAMSGSSRDGGRRASGR